MVDVYIAELVIEFVGRARSGGWRTQIIYYGDGAGHACTCNGIGI